MKSTKLLLAGALAASAATVANAQTVIHITGSTAFRSGTHAAITNILESGYTFAFSGSTLGSASQAIFTGTAAVNGAPVIIKTSWSGSLGGIQTVSQQLNVSTWLASTTPQSTWPGTSGASATYDTPTPPDVAMSDGFQSSTPFTSPALVDQKVGIIPFKWVASADAPLSFTNVTPRLVQNLFKAGKTPLALFTGQFADENTTVWATGRDNDSGTRLTAFAESGVGVFTVVKQYLPTITGQSGGYGGTVVSQVLWTNETINGISLVTGNGGYSGGGALAAALTAHSSTTTGMNGGFYLGYLGLSDANNATGHGAKEVAWNGFYYSTNAVQEGQYTFWGYEHLMYRSDYTGVGKTVANAIASMITTNTAAVAGLTLGSMNVSRPIDGGAISTLY